MTFCSFISTLLTAVLTHHLGWVATTFSGTYAYSHFHKPCNALWGQLVDLYGAVGHPAKIAHTVITGTNNSDVISKILNSLTYFIRCCDIERKNTVRVDVEKENALINSICHEYSCIPKEHYKKYEDHLREMENCSAKEIKIKKEDYSTSTSEPQTPLTVGACTTKEQFLLSEKISMDVQTLCDKPTADENSTETSLSDNKKVVFVLGDDENLDCIKNEINCDRYSTIQQSALIKNVGKGLTKETSCFDLKNYMNVKETDKNTINTFKHVDGIETKFCSKTLQKTPHVVSSEVEDRSCLNSTFKDEDFIKYKDVTADVNPSTSFSSLKSDAGCSSNTTTEKQKENDFIRSKSVPLEQPKPKINDEVKSRYKYCGVKFNFQQYPQIVTNYMKSKNIELSRLPFMEKEIDYNQITLNTDAAFNFMDSDDNDEELEALQTPSNASELECVSDLVTERHRECYAKESIERLPKTFIRSKVPNTVVKEPANETDTKEKQMKIILLPMPK